MNEIEKLYKNAGIKKEKKKMLDRETGKIALTLDKLYPPFTAEKQLNLIKWLCQNTYRNYLTIHYFFDFNSWRIYCDMEESIEANTFERALASIVNSLWQNLTSEEKEQIRGILNV